MGVVSVCRSVSVEYQKYEDEDVIGLLIVTGAEDGA